MADVTGWNWLRERICGPDDSEPPFISVGAVRVSDDDLNGSDIEVALLVRPDGAARIVITGSDEITLDVVDERG